MEACILTFSGVDGADDALKKVVEAQESRNPWLHEVGVVRRPPLGRISIRATFSDDDHQEDDQETEVREGEIAGGIADAGGMTGYLVGSLAGPLHADMAMVEGELSALRAGKALEELLLHTDDVKNLVPRGASALVLIAAPEINDRFVGLFSSRSSEVIRGDVAPEVQQRLATFARKTREDIARQRAAAH